MRPKKAPAFTFFGMAVFCLIALTVALTAPSEGDGAIWAAIAFGLAAVGFVVWGISYLPVMNRTVVSPTGITLIRWGKPRHVAWGQITEVILVPGKHGQSSIGLRLVPGTVRNAWLTKLNHVTSADVVLSGYTQCAESHVAWLEGLRWSYAAPVMPHPGFQPQNLGQGIPPQ